MPRIYGETLSDVARQGLARRQLRSQEEQAAAQRMMVGLDQMQRHQEAEKQRDLQRSLAELAQTARMGELELEREHRSREKELDRDLRREEMTGWRADQTEARRLQQQDDRDWRIASKIMDGLGRGTMDADEAKAMMETIANPSTRESLRASIASSRAAEQAYMSTAQRVARSMEQRMQPLVEEAEAAKQALEDATSRSWWVRGTASAVRSAESRLAEAQQALEAAAAELPLDPHFGQYYDVLDLEGIREGRVGVVPRREAGVSPLGVERPGERPTEFQPIPEGPVGAEAPMGEMYVPRYDVQEPVPPVELTEPRTPAVGRAETPWTGDDMQRAMDRWVSDRPEEMLHIPGEPEHGDRRLGHFHGTGAFGGAWVPPHTEPAGPREPVTRVRDGEMFVRMDDGQFAKVITVRDSYGNETPQSITVGNNRVYLTDRDQRFYGQELARIRALPGHTDATAYEAALHSVMERLYNRGLAR